MERFKGFMMYDSLGTFLKAIKMLKKEDITIRKVLP
jgi:hypothetical protein